MKVVFCTDLAVQASRRHQGKGGDLPGCSDLFCGCLRNDPQLEGAASAKGLRRRNKETRTLHSKVTVQLSVLTQIVNFSVCLSSSEKQGCKQYQGCFLGLVKTHKCFLGSLAGS